MRVVLHEWSCSGGLHAAASSGAASEAVVAEGRAMLAALAADGLRSGALEIMLLLDAALPPLPLPLPAGQVRVERVGPGEELDRLVRAARAADWTVIVAPESSGILAERVALVRGAGARVAAPGPAFLGHAADKQATVGILAGGGVPVPAGRRLAPGEGLPPGFALPAVVKALDGCGGAGHAVVETADGLPADGRPRRLEALIAGVSVGVSALCGPAGRRMLPPVRHRFSTGPRRRFLGGDLALPAPLAARASALADRAIGVFERATDPAAGWVGVDMILGGRDDGAADRVLEINPRLTTSFVGLAASGSRSLLESLLAVAGGAPADWPGPTAGDGAFLASPP